MGTAGTKHGQCNFRRFSYEMPRQLCCGGELHLPKKVLFKKLQDEFLAHTSQAPSDENMTVSPTIVSPSTIQSKRGRHSTKNRLEDYKMGLSIAELAERGGVSKEAIKQWIKYNNLTIPDDKTPTKVTPLPSYSRRELPIFSRQSCVLSTCVSSP